MSAKDRTGSNLRGDGKALHADLTIAHAPRKDVASRQQQKEN